MKIGEKAAGEISDRSAHLVYEGEWEGRWVVWRLRWQGSSQKIVAREMVSPWVKVTCQRSPTFHRNGSVPVSCPTQHFAGRSSGERLWHILDGIEEQPQLRLSVNDVVPKQMWVAASQNVLQRSASPLTAKSTICDFSEMMF